MNNIKIEYLPISALKEYEKNARKHSEKDIDTIVSSIGAFGFNDPIGIWGKNNIVVEGHGRLLAAKKIGMETVPVIRLDHLSDKQRKAYALAHNKTAEASEWDFVNLNSELEDLNLDFDMSDFGFDKITEGLGEEPPEEDFKVPEKFKEYGDDMKTQHVCPRCGYEWN